MRTIIVISHRNGFETNKVFCPYQPSKHITKTNKSSDKNHYLEIGGRLNLREIEEAFSRFKVCPKCSSTEGFWLGLKGGYAYVRCKGCGAKFELFEVARIGEKGKAPKRLRFLRR